MITFTVVPARQSYLCHRELCVMGFSMVTGFYVHEKGQQVSIRHPKYAKHVVPNATCEQRRYEVASAMRRRLVEFATTYLADASSEQPYDNDSFANYMTEGGLMTIPDDERDSAVLTEEGARIRKAELYVVAEVDSGRTYKHISLGNRLVLNIFGRNGVLGIVNIDELMLMYRSNLKCLLFSAGA
jgi:hypothetical protein